MRVLAAMSGGVDSAVAAALAVDAGHDVTGVHLALSPDRQTLRSGARGCCSVEDAHDARRVADELGIPFYVWDLADRFREDVVDDFVAEYAAGRTPNPCLRCNEKIKFAAVLDRARALGLRRRRHRAPRPARRTASCAGRSTPPRTSPTCSACSRPSSWPAALFPLGSMTKERVREIAAERGFAVATKPDSHDICFIPDGDTRGFLARRLGQPAGAGRRRGHRRDGRASTTAPTGSPSASAGGSGVAVGDQRPRYVLGIEPVTRTVTVGTADLAGVDEVRTGVPDLDRSGAGAAVRGAGPAPGRTAARVRRCRGAASPTRTAGCPAVACSADATQRGRSPRPVDACSTGPTPGAATADARGQAAATLAASWLRPGPSTAAGLSSPP